MLDFLFNPRSIAVIGASRIKGKLGNDVLKNILTLGYKGKVYPVNPKAKKILGKICYPSVKDIKGKVDLAVIIVPAPFVSQVLEECGQKGIPAAIIISAGFKEIGKEGLKREKEVIKIAKRYKINILGPNCLGLINVNISLNASFAEGMPYFGNVSLISQSGAMAVAILDKAKKQNFGFNKIISLGNKAVLTENEILEYLAQDKSTKVIAIYLENISNGQEFIKIAKKITSRKPIIILKAGITQAAAQAISFHTGVLAGSNEAVDAAFKQAGVIRASTMEDLFNLSKAFSYQSFPQSNRIAIITNAGGPGVMATDAMENLSISLAKFSKITSKTLKRKLPQAASIHNPVDLIGDAKADRYQLVLKAVLGDKNVDGIIIILTPQTVTEVEKTAEVVSQYNFQYKNKPILCAFLGGKRVSLGIEILNKNKIPNFNYPEEAIKIMNVMWEYSKGRKERRKETVSEIRIIPKTKEEIERIFKKAYQQKQKVVIGIEAEKLLKAYNLPVVRSGLAKSLNEGLKIAAKIGYPVAIKIISPDIIRKTDVAGVRTNISNKEEFRTAFQMIKKSVQKKIPTAKIQGILIQKMIEKGTEIILGMRRDPQFGPLLMFGLGGIYAEVLKDVSFRLAPLTKNEAEKMIFEIKSRKIIEGVRGKEPLDVKAISDCLCQLSQLALDWPQIDQIDINPFFAFEKGKGGIVVDVRFLLK